jgi:hypothetical protein
MLVALAMLIVAVIASSLGVSWQAAIIMGGVVGMSSTAITPKQLSDDGELASQRPPRSSRWPSKPGRFPMLHRMRSDPGQNIVFGDASRSRVLHRAGVKRARLLAVTFDERRALDGLSKRRVSGESGDGLALADRVLLLNGLDQEQAASIVTRIRPRINSELRDPVEV